MEKDILYRFEQMERKYRNLKFIFIGCLVLGLVGFMSFSFSATATKQTEKFDLIRAKGIIIEDNAGKDRILIGAPLPASKDRVLSNETKHITAFGKWDGKNKWRADYKDLRTTVNGMAVVNSEGFDIVTVGEDLPGPNGGKRIGKMDGLLFGNNKGRERAGFGVITPEGLPERVVLGMDSDKAEGIALFVMDKVSAVTVNDGENRAAFGNIAPKFFWNKSDKPFSGYMFLGKDDKIKHQFNALEEKPTK